MGLLNKGFFLGRKGIETKELSFKKMILRTLIAAVLAAVAVLLVACLAKNSFIFYPRKGIELSPASIGWEFYDIFLETEDGIKINAWHLPSSEGRETILLLHGNGGNLTEMMGRVIVFRKMGFGILAIDYRGFGLSEGSPSEEGIYRDAEAAYEYLVDGKGLDPEDIIIYGFSLGGGAAAYLAEKRIDGKSALILDSTFTNLEEAAKGENPILGFLARFAVKGDFDANSRLKSISPKALLIFHSPEDQIIPYRLAEKNFSDYRGGPKEFFKLKGLHMDFPVNADVYASALDKWFPKKNKEKPSEGKAS
jgi:fermentation-respiration switch protein FrsA (DUF1100 family)